MKNHKNSFIVICILLILGITACTSPSSPKKKGYVRMDFPKAAYALSTDSLPFIFDLSNQARLSWKMNKVGEYFCNIDYPLLNARVYCTYHAITSSKFRNFAEESHKMAYQHTSVATGIKEQAYQNNLSHVYGLIYDIQGDVATPLQVALTDSNSYFFNASLYFNIVPNADSIAPAVNYIRKDIVRMMESFTLKKQK